MPAAHMLAMTWFKSTHRSWYFSCYAGKETTKCYCDQQRDLVIRCCIIKNLFSSCKCRLLFDWVAWDRSCTGFRQRFTVLRSHDTGIVLVFPVRSLCQRQPKVLSARY